MCSCKIRDEDPKNERQETSIVVITSFSGNLPRYHYQMASIVSWIVMILVNVASR